MKYGKSYHAQWSKSHLGNGKKMRYDFYSKQEQLQLAKKSAMKDKANFLFFDGETYERHGSRWYKW